MITTISEYTIALKMADVVLARVVLGKGSIVASRSTGGVIPAGAVVKRRTKQAEQS